MAEQFDSKTAAEEQLLQAAHAVIGHDRFQRVHDSDAAAYGELYDDELLAAARVYVAVHEETPDPKWALERSGLLNALGSMLDEAARCTCMDGEAQQTAMGALGVYEASAGRLHEQRLVILGSAAYGAPGSETAPE